MPLGGLTAMHATLGLTAHAQKGVLQLCMPLGGLTAMHATLWSYSACATEYVQTRRLAAMHATCGGLTAMPAT